MPFTIYHNPACVTSRAALVLIRGRGIEPEVVEYLRDPPDRVALAGLLARLGIGARALLRTKQPEYRALGLDDPALSEAQLVAAMAANPILIERPVVVGPDGARLCRPAERVLELP